MNAESLAINVKGTLGDLAFAREYYLHSIQELIKNKTADNVVLVVKNSKYLRDTSQKLIDKIIKFVNKNNSKKTKDNSINNLLQFISLLEKINFNLNILATKITSEINLEGLIQPKDIERLLNSNSIKDVISVINKDLSESAVLQNQNMIFLNYAMEHNEGFLSILKTSFKKIIDRRETLISIIKEYYADANNFTFDSVKLGEDIVHFIANGEINELRAKAKPMFVKSIQARLYEKEFLNKGPELVINEDLDSQSLITYSSFPRIHIMAIIKLKKADIGNVAKNAKILQLIVRDTKTIFVEKSIYFKFNSSSAITSREVKILDGIRNDHRLKKLRVTSPQVYKTKDNTFAIEYLDYPTVESLIQSEAISGKTKDSILARILEATKIIENQTQNYLSGLYIDEQADFDRNYALFIKTYPEKYSKITKYIELLRNRLEQKDERKLPLSKQSYELELKRVLKQKEYLDLVFDILKKRAPLVRQELRGKTNAATYFQKSKFDVIKNLGLHHQRLIEDSNFKHYMDVPISDSRLANWLYDEKNDMLVKIDENIVATGSDFWFISKICDYNDTLDYAKRNELLYSYFPQVPRLYLHLSLYVSNYISAQFLLSCNKADIGKKRLIRALLDLQVACKYNSSYAWLLTELKNNKIIN